MPTTGITDTAQSLRAKMDKIERVARGAICGDIITSQGDDDAYCVSLPGHAGEHNYVPVFGDR